MITCCTLRSPQHRKAPHNCQRHLPWCRGSWRCTSLSCTPLRMNTCCTLRCPRHRKAPLNRQRHLHWCRKELALHVTELHAPTAAAEPCNRQWHLHWRRRSWRRTSSSCTQKQLRLNTCCTLRCPPNRKAPRDHRTLLMLCRGRLDETNHRTARRLDIAHLHDHRTLLMVMPAVVWRRLPPAPFSLAAMALAMAGRHGRHRSSPRSPEACSWLSRQSSGRKPPPAPASLAAMALVMAGRHGRHHTSPRSPKAFT